MNLLASLTSCCSY